MLSPRGDSALSRSPRGRLTAIRGPIPQFFDGRRHRSSPSSVHAPGIPSSRS